MTNSSATYTRNIVVDFPDWASGTVLFELRTFFAAAGTEGFPQKEYTLTLSGTGQGTQALPVPDNTGAAAWLWRITTPDGNKPLATLAYGADLQLTAWLAAALSEETAASLVDSFVLKAGDAMTGPLTFSGTDHAGVMPISLTTAERDALTPAEGMFIYNETDSKFQAYQGGAWVDYGSGGAGAVDSVFARTGDVVAATSDYDAVQVDFTPAGTIAATNVQAAVEEVNSDATAGINSVAAALIAHGVATTSVHGISNTANLLTTSNIGSTVQAYSAKTAAIAALTWAANSIILLTGTGTAAVQALAAHVVTFIQSASAADARAAIGAAALGANTFTGTQNLGANTLTNYKEGVTTVSPTTSYAVSMLNEIVVITLTDNLSISFTDITAGASVTVHLIQDGTGNRVPSWTGVSWPEGTEPTLSTGAADRDKLVFDSFNGSIVDGHLVALNMS